MNTGEEKGRNHPTLGKGSPNTVAKREKTVVRLLLKIHRVTLKKEANPGIAARAAREPTVAPAQGRAHEQAHGMANTLDRRNRLDLGMVTRHVTIVANQVTSGGIV